MSALPQAFQAWVDDAPIHKLNELDAIEKSLPAISPVSLAELDRMRLTPRKLAHDLLYADVRCRIAAGGVGKTTLALFEAASLALGRAVWGRAPLGPLNTLFVTREDGSELLYARLREIMRGMSLSDTERAWVLDRVRIMDLTVTPFRLSLVVGDVVLPHTESIGDLIGHIESEGFRPDWVIFDPAVSFGVGESRVNDAEQGLIEAARIIRNRLDCCVEFIHHSGKANSRDKTLDQYSGRGGSAFADGSRMVAVLQPLDPAEWIDQTGTALADDESGMVMALPKLSYAPPQPHVFIRRRGWVYEAVEASAEAKAEAIKEQAEIHANAVYDYLRQEASTGRRYSGRDLMNDAQTRNLLGLSKHEISSAVTWLKVRAWVTVEGENGKKQWLEPMSVTSETRPTESGTGAAK